MNEKLEVQFIRTSNVPGSVYCPFDCKFLRERVHQKKRDALQGWNLFARQELVVHVVLRHTKHPSLIVNM
eukprot:1159279-Pelagomonas_calceolata.AAC.9